MVGRRRQLKTVPGLCDSRMHPIEHRVHAPPAAVPRVIDRGRHLYAKLSSNADVAECGGLDTKATKAPYNTSSYTSEAMLLRRQPDEKGNHTSSSSSSSSSTEPRKI